MGCLDASRIRYLTQKMTIFHPFPTKEVPDHRAIVEHVRLHGFMLLDMGTNYYSARCYLIRYGMSIRKVTDPETGLQAGWRAALRQKVLNI